MMHGCGAVLIRRININCLHMLKENIVPHMTNDSINIGMVMHMINIQVRLTACIYMPNLIVLFKQLLHDNLQSRLQA